MARLLLEQLAMRCKLQMLLRDRDARLTMGELPCTARVSPTIT